MLAYLKQSGHPYYQFYDDVDTYHRRCRMQQVNGDEFRKKAKLKFVSDGETKRMVDLTKKRIPDDTDFQVKDNESDSDDEVQYVQNDPVRKF
jgi:hypothetical protein